RASAAPPCAAGDGADALPAACAAARGTARRTLEQRADQPARQAVPVAHQHRVGAPRGLRDERQAEQAAHQRQAGGGVGGAEGVDADVDAACRVDRVDGLHQRGARGGAAGEVSRRAVHEGEPAGAVARLEVADLAAAQAAAAVVVEGERIGGAGLHDRHFRYFSQNRNKGAKKETGKRSQSMGRLAWRSASSSQSGPPGRGALAAASPRTNRCTLAPRLSTLSSVPGDRRSISSAQAPSLSISSIVARMRSCASAGSRAKSGLATISRSRRVVGSNSRSLRSRTTVRNSSHTSTLVSK